MWASSLILLVQTLTTKHFVIIKWVVSVIMVQFNGFHHYSFYNYCANEERLKMRIAVLEESVKSSELESKASRDMAMRLMKELEQEKKKAAGSAGALESLRLVFKQLHFTSTVQFALKNLQTLRLSLSGAGWSGGRKKER